MADQERLQQFAQLQQVIQIVSHNMVKMDTRLTQQIFKLGGRMAQGIQASCFVFCPIKRTRGLRAYECSFCTCLQNRQSP